MPSISDLPDELLLYVISQVPSHQDVAALSQQCRRLNRLCDMNMRRKYRKIKLSRREDMERARDMLLSILRKPQLGKYLQHLELDQSSSSSFTRIWRSDICPAKISLQPEDQERVSKAIKNAGFEGPKEDEVLNMLLQDMDPAKKIYNDTTKFGYPGTAAFFIAQALATLLVSVAPNLESLALCPIGWELSKWSQRRVEAQGRSEPPSSYIFRSSLLHANTKKTGELPYLQNLRTVRFISDRDCLANDGRFYEDYDVSGSLNMARRLPSIETVRFDAVQKDENSSVRLPPRSANYSRIIIRYSILDSEVYTNVIESAKALREVTFSIGGRASSDGSFCPVYPTRLFKSLFEHRKTLEHLDLDVEDSVHGLFRDYPSRKYDEDDEDEFNEEEYKAEWEDELQELASATPDDNARESPAPYRLRSFENLKHLSLGIQLLYYYARGIEEDKIKDEDHFSLVDYLPPNIESLCIYGYEKGNMTASNIAGLRLDEHISTLLAEKDVKLPFLKSIEGVDELIPNDKMVDDPDSEEAPLWEREEEDWTEYEY